MPTAAEPNLRRATEADVDAITRLVADAYGPYAALIGRTPLPMLTDFADAVASREVWVLDAAGRIVGVLELVPHEDHLWVENVAVAPGVQGQGLGRRLLAHADAEARRHGLDEVRLLTNERYIDNIAMYLRYGFVETHREPHLGTDLVHFRKALTGPGG